MKNRIVGGMIISISLLIGFIIYTFNKALSGIIDTACNHGSECPMWGTLKIQTNISAAIMIFVISIGIYLFFFGDEKKPALIHKTVKKKNITLEQYAEILADLKEEEKDIFTLIIKSQGTIFQSKIVEKTGLSKVKVTRILDRLEGRKLIERRRRGMTNVVILKS